MLTCKGGSGPGRESGTAEPTLLLGLISPSHHSRPALFYYLPTDPCAGFLEESDVHHLALTTSGGGQDMLSSQVAFVTAAKHVMLAEHAFLQHNAVLKLGHVKGADLASLEL